MAEEDPKPNADDEPKPTPATFLGDKGQYVWQQFWFQWVLGTIVVFLFLSFVLPPIYWVLTKLSPVLTPVLLGLGLAYVFNPLTMWAERRHGIKRPVTAGLILGGLLVVLAITVPLIIASAIRQGALLSANADEYAQTILGWIGSDLDEAQKKVLALVRELDWRQLDAGALKKALGIGAGALMAGIGLLTYALMFMLVTGFCFFVFTWRLEKLKAWFADFIPKPYRPETLRILGLMDDTVSAIVRGRLVQSLVVMVVLCAGWGIVGVKYWLLLGVLGGVLNLLPYAAMISWPIAVAMTVVDKADGGTAAIVWAVILPSLVYFAAQSLDGFVVEPMVQGKATGMDALTVLLVVLAGGALLGILGVVLAVPVAACVKILSQELLLPKLRAFVDDPPDFRRDGA